ncbi:MAG: N-acetylmuramoyl-L-alanine amidase [Faecousia sp.]
MHITMVERPITKNQAYLKNVQQADSRYTDFQKRGARGAVLHSVGVPRPSAKAIADYFDSPKVEASVHAVLQADGVCYQLAPWNYRMWHVGGSANDTHIGIEMTEPDSIVYDTKNGYKLTILDRAQALEYVRATYAAAVELFAGLCKEFHWNPLADGVILSHAECCKRGIGSNHGDPEHLWDALGTGYSMDTFRAAVKQKMEEEEEMRYNTLGDIKADKNNAPYYLPTIEKLMAKGILRGKGGEGDNTIIDLGEDAIRVLVTLDRAGVYGG